MSLITRCPACTTMFRVVPDQLRISDGWVRCGQCDEVFDANAQLVVEAPGGPGDPSGSTITAAESTAPAPPATVAVPAPEVAPEPMPVDIDIDVGIDADADAGDTPLADAFLEENPHAASPPALEAEEPEANTPDRVEFAEVDEDGETEDPQPDTSPRYLQADVQEGPAAADPRLSFLRPVRSRSGRSRPGVRIALVLLSLLLVAGLLLQVVVQERDRIAATEPATQPFLESVCAVLACKVSPLRQIESVVIDSSSFTKVRADVYRLNFTLKNTALTAVATPAVELTLTDLQDQSVVRRVFLAPDFGARQAAMAPGSELAASLSVSVSLPGELARISGYRLLAFYP
ncbi:MAG: DUF3426 domain-containing protein [Rhodoferax sp.]